MAGKSRRANTSWSGPLPRGDLFRGRLAKSVGARVGGCEELEARLAKREPPRPAAVIPRVENAGCFGKQLAAKKPTVHNCAPRVGSASACTRFTQIAAMAPEALPRDGCRGVSRGLSGCRGRRPFRPLDGGSQEAAGSAVPFWPPLFAPGSKPVGWPWTILLAPGSSGVALVMLVSEKVDLTRLPASKKVPVAMADALA